MLKLEIVYIFLSLVMNEMYVFVHVSVCCA